MDPTFPYAGKVRVPPKEFLLRSRIETNTKDWVNNSLNIGKQMFPILHITIQKWYMRKDECMKT